MLFGQTAGKKITSSTPDTTLKMPNPSCKMSYCAMLCTGYFDCVAFNAKIIRPCVCELFLSLNETFVKTDNADWMAAQILPKY